MTMLQNIRLLLPWTLLSASLLSAGGLSEYREFQLDSDLDGLAKQAGVNPAEAKIVHEYPAVIQELSWRGESHDSVQEILFSFYNGELFRMVVDYDRSNTEGLTAKDVIEALSATYGTAAHPSAEITVPAVYGGDETVDVMARWEDESWSFNLVRFKYETTFALVALSKRLHAQALVAVDEAVRRERLEAPQREREPKTKRSASSKKKRGSRINQASYRKPACSGLSITCAASDDRPFQDEVNYDESSGSGKCAFEVSGRYMVESLLDKPASDTGSTRQDCRDPGWRPHLFRRQSADGH
jgi:hypothetical protein